MISTARDPSVVVADEWNAAIVASLEIDDRHRLIHTADRELLAGRCEGQAVDTVLHGDALRRLAGLVVEQLRLIDTIAASARSDGQLVRRIGAAVQHARLRPGIAALLCRAIPVDRLDHFPRAEVPSLQRIVVSPAGRQCFAPVAADGERVTAEVRTVDAAHGVAGARVPQLESVVPATKRNASEITS